MGGGFAALFVCSFLAACGPDITPQVVKNNTLVLPMEVRSRQEWKARSHQDNIDPFTRPINQFVVHHTAGSDFSSDATVRGIQDEHMNGNGWADIGYHYLVGSDGKIWEGREKKFVGAHVKGSNANTLGLTFLGCYDDEQCPKELKPVSQETPHMFEAMGYLIANLALYANVSNLNRNTVKGHLEMPNAATACPGNRVLSKIETIIEWAVACLHDLRKNKDAPCRITI